MTGNQWNLTGDANPPVYRTKADWAYQCLRERIQTGELKAGDRLDQETLARELDVSRVPLRHALVRLKADELVVGRPHGSVKVAPLSLGHAEDIYASRSALESMLVEVAVGRLDEPAVAELEALLEAQQAALEAADRTHLLRLDRRFHMRLYEQSGYQTSVNLVDRLREMSDRYIATFQSTAERSEAALAEHRELVRACARRDAGRASELIRAHVAGGIVFLRTLLVEPPESETPAAVAPDEKADHAIRTQSR